VKTKPGAGLVSSVFLMCLRDRVHVYGDCAVIPNPNAEQLAEIALSSAETARVFGIEPRVAMLSYSTGKSGSGEEVEKVTRATEIARERAADASPSRGRSSSTPPWTPRSPRPRCPAPTWPGAPRCSSSPT
jgi:phosphate acetyltransferase